MAKQQNVSGSLRVRWNEATAYSSSCQEREKMKAFNRIGCCRARDAIKTRIERKHTTRKRNSLSLHIGGAHKKKRKRKIVRDDALQQTHNKRNLITIWSCLYTLFMLFCVLPVRYIAHTHLFTARIFHSPWSFSSLPSLCRLPKNERNKKIKQKTPREQN